jgi:MYXO-CTERM domain-containing protein
MTLPSQRSRIGRGLASALATCWLLAVPSTAHAIPDYPEALRTAAAMPCAPPCTVCHIDSNGGKGTVVKPFGLAMMSHGLTKEDKALIRPAVLELYDQAVDSDGDGMGDISELDQGRDPNVAGNDSVCGPEYGCTAADPKDGTSSRAALAFLSGLGFLLVIRRKRAS